VPLDPQLEPLVQLMSSAGESRPLAEQTVDEVRAGLVALSFLLGEPEEVGGIEDLAIPGPGGDLSVRLYRPAGTGPFGALVYLHGGGFVIGSVDTHDHLCRELANRAGCVVVSVEYRLAPEAPFPAAVDDCWAAFQWVRDHGASYGIDVDRLAVGGDSAGGNLAAVLARRTRDEGEVVLRLQLLVYPVTDMRPVVDWPSRVHNASGYVLTTEMMDWFHGHYLGGEGGDHPDATPLLAEDLAGLAPAHVVLAEFDPLHDEGAAYAERLAAAGVPVDVRDYEGAIHIFFQLGPVTDLGRRAVDEAAVALGLALQP
jgi:acetyl esterase